MCSFLQRRKWRFMLAQARTCSGDGIRHHGEHNIPRKRRFDSTSSSRLIYTLQQALTDLCKGMATTSNTPSAGSACPSDFRRGDARVCGRGEPDNLGLGVRRSRAFCSAKEADKQRSSYETLDSMFREQMNLEDLPPRPMDTTSYGSQDSLS